MVYLGNDKYTARHAKWPARLSERVQVKTPAGELAELIELCETFMILTRNTRLKDGLRVERFERANAMDSDVTDIYVTIEAKTKHPKPEILKIDASCEAGEYWIYMVEFRERDPSGTTNDIRWRIVDYREDENLFYGMTPAHAADLVIERIVDLIGSVNVVIPEIR